jgi:peptide/nickel transport system substrate-binding protein
MEPLYSPSYKRQNFIDRFFNRLHSLKASDAFLLKCALFACFVFLVLTLIQVSRGNATSIATDGGTFSEGVVGTPRFVNPVLAVTRADKDLSALIYDGLMTLGKDGVLVPNIAESVTISEDGLTYNVILKDSVKFHDGTPLTAEDVVFTFNRIQDPLLPSPLRASLDGIKIEEVGEHEINFILPEAYSPFIENLTFGIIPQHIWKEAGSEDFSYSQVNTEPVGSGPYKVKKIIRTQAGIPETYILTRNTDYHGGAPKIETVELHFFPTDEKLAEAFKEKIVESAVGIDPLDLTDYDLDQETHHLERIPLPRTFAVFFNQNKSLALRDKSARKALDVALDRDELVRTVLDGYGNALTSPVPKGFGVEIHTTTDTPASRIDAARDILREGGWKFNAEKQIWEKTIEGTLTPLSFSIATVNNSAFEATASFLEQTWKQLGAEVTVKQFEQSDLTQAVIRPRDYEALLFGTQLGRSFDYYSFWHSSQRNDPGLNIALYANITTDSILAEMRRKATGEDRTEALQKFAEELSKETPALFLYSPELLYVFPNRIQGITFTGVGERHERFAGIKDWYVETESVWPFFKK